MDGTETSTLLFAIASYDVAVLLISFLSCLIIIIIAARRFERISGRKQDLTSVQSSHTPRIGGLGIFLALLGTLYFAPVSLSVANAQFLAATAILFFVGLAEDVEWHMSPWTRLTAAALASIAAIVLLEVWVPRFDIPGLDPWVGHWAVGVPLTVLLIRASQTALT